MLWFAWMFVYAPILILMFIFKVPEHIFVPIAVIGALALIAWDLKEIFTSFRSSNTFFGEGRKAKKILETGRSATATVIALNENSKGGVVTINDQPLLNLKLLVDDNQNPAYEVSFDTIISRSAVPQFQPGAIFKVKIDLTDPQIVVIDFERQELAQKPEVLGKGRTTEDDKIIDEQGLAGVAKLVAVEDTGKSEKLQPVIKLRWEVTCDKWGTYTNENEFTTTTTMAKQFQSVIGKSFTTKIHPEKKKSHVN